MFSYLKYIEKHDKYKYEKDVSVNKFSSLQNSKVKEC